ncbi:16S rRNA (cytosine(967)-C(5))-methyltransferase [Phormidium sp. CLA17]|uniref:16S rRNA (cytosine(967)-C(5))-methyltransferase n=1 Tax=Leptolyngbya sp. Cla-17 TaxID=2803751 RepID=UPI00149201E5|nr:16S rRNA (cytosine(967)-C(5))-methyltransferase [Leptolyngbya sp. Cla-17]MBM0741766.1 16S rRNA (cytosine(967)-C(5))-methyltransferase [Leptolyngbya sp. Cla-17]
MAQDPRQQAFLALQAISRGGFADDVLAKTLQQDLSEPDKRLATELVYGSVRRQRTLDALITQLGKKQSDRQPPNLRLILHLGLYQLRYLTHVPPSAAVNTSVELAKSNGFAGLAGVVNGILRQYIRLLASDSLQLPSDPIQRLAVLYSYPDWIVEVWQAQFGLENTEKLCDWMNQSPRIDLRVNPLRASIEQVEAAMQESGVLVERSAVLPQALRLVNHAGAIRNLPGFEEGWWMVQDWSAQLVSHCVNPQPGETVIDACAAPGGKSTHLAELMGDSGVVYAYDKTPSRLKKVQQNCDRLGLHSIQVEAADSRALTHTNQADRVLVDAPCSGLGTLHRHADARWRQTPTTVQDLATLQAELLNQAATWVKPHGVLVYATCTLHPAENENQIQHFLTTHPDWKLQPIIDFPASRFVSSAGWIKVLPYQHSMDGFFMAQLSR